MFSVSPTIYPPALHFRAGTPFFCILSKSLFRGFTPNYNGGSMQFPLSSWDLSLWLAVNAIILLITAEIVSLYRGKAFRIEKRNLRKVAMALGILFIIIVMTMAYQRLMAIQH